MLTTNDKQNLQAQSGERLLLMAVFGPRRMRARIDRELDRRATTGTATFQHPSTITHHAYRIEAA